MGCKPTILKPGASIPQLGSGAFSGESGADNQPMGELPYFCALTYRLICNNLDFGRCLVACY